MRTQLTTVGDRLTTLAKDLRAQAEAQRVGQRGRRRRHPAGAGLGGGLVRGATPGAGRVVPRSGPRRPAGSRPPRRGPTTSGGCRSATWPTAPRPQQLAWWNGLTDDQRAACCATTRARCSGSRGCRRRSRAEARAAYIDSVRGDIEISSTEDKIEGELNIAWVHLGVEGTAAIVQLADGTYRVDLDARRRDRRQRRRKGAKGHVGIGGGVSQSYEFDSPGRRRGVRRRPLRQADARRRLVRPRRARRRDGRHRRRRRRLPRRPQRPAHERSRASSGWRARSTSSSARSTSTSAARPAPATTSTATRRRCSSAASASRRARRARRPATARPAATSCRPTSRRR